MSAPPASSPSAEFATPAASSALPASLPAKPAPSASIRRITDDSGETAYRTRVQALRGLGKHLCREDIGALYALLYRPEAEDGLRASYLNALKNAVANALLAQDPPPLDFGQHLMALHRQARQHPTWRDYCLQFLGQWYPRSRLPGEKEDIIALLDSVAAKHDSSMAGTALLSLMRNVGRSGVESDRVGRLALALAEDEEANDAARVTALQVCARLEDMDALFLARRLARQPAARACLRMSAIAAIGVLGDLSDLSLLTDLAASSDVRIKVAARAALRRLEGPAAQ